jgi:hypothetical protein
VPDRHPDHDLLRELEPVAGRRGAGRQRPHGRAAAPCPSQQGPGPAAAPRSLGGRQLSSALRAGGLEVAVGVRVRATYHGPAGWADPMVDPGQQPQSGRQKDSLEERARRRVMVREGRLCAAAVAAPQGGKR